MIEIDFIFVVFLFHVFDVGCTINQLRHQKYVFCSLILFTLSTELMKLGSSILEIAFSELCFRRKSKDGILRHLRTLGIPIKKASKQLEYCTYFQI